MKKGFIYLLLFVVAAGIVGFVLAKENKKTTTYAPLKERVPKLAVGAEWAQTKKVGTDLYAKVTANPNDVKSRMKLAELYIQEARITGDHMYYDRASMQLVNDVLKKDSANFEALSFKSMIYLSEHHFTDGLAYAQKAQASNPYNAFVYGLMTDAYVELGNYKAAVEATDKMISIRPDMRSYARASYLREIYGDYPGAIEAMKMAVTAGYPGLEETEWTRMQLGHLYEYTGNLQGAEQQYQGSLLERPDYAYAYAGLGRIAIANKKYAEAIAYYQKADSLVEDYSFKDELIDLYAMNGDKEQSKKMTDQVLDKLNGDAQGSAKDDNIGHYADRELAYVYIKKGDYDKAVDHALMEYNRRPANIDANETVAWAYYKKGDAKKAAEYLPATMVTNSKNPVLLLHAALIYQKNGNTAKAKELMAEAMKNNPNISPTLLAEANTAVGTTTPPVAAK